MMVRDVLLFLLIGVCSYTDLRSRKVYNAVTVPAAAAGLLLSYLAGGGESLYDSFAGLCAGFGALFFVYLLGGVGAGDVKFMAAAGAVCGFDFIVIGGLYGAVLGGIAALSVLLWRGRSFSTVREIGISLYCLLTFRTPESIRFDHEKSIKLPYTVFLSAGLLARWCEELWRR